MDCLQEHADAIFITIFILLIPVAVAGGWAIGRFERRREMNRNRKRLTP